MGLCSVHLYSALHTVQAVMRVTPALTLASTGRNVQIGDQITTETITAQTKSSQPQVFTVSVFIQNHKIFQKIIIISPATVKRCQELIQYILLEISTFNIPS